MATITTRLDHDPSSTEAPHPVLQPEQEAIRDLEYHALMGVSDADMPAHFASFAREVIEAALGHHDRDEATDLPAM